MILFEQRLRRWLTHAKIKLWTNRHYAGRMANRALLLALDSIDPPAEHDGMYPSDALLAANYSVPVLWLSLFDADGLVTWPGISDDSPFTSIAQPRSECIQRSRARLADWSRRWPEVFLDMSEPWLCYIDAV